MKTKLLDRKVNDMTWKGYIGLMVVCYTLAFAPYMWTYRDDVKDWFKDKFHKKED